MAFGSIWKFGADNSEYKKAVREMPSEMDKAASQIEGRTKKMAASSNSIMKEFASLLAGPAIMGGFKSLVDNFDRIGDLATRFGTNAESIQRIGVAAQLAGTDIEAIATAMTKAGVAASKAATEGGAAADLFAKAGLNAQAFASSELDQKLLMVSRAFAAAGDDANKTNAIIEILGTRAGANLIPLISNVEELEKAMAGANVASNESVENLQRADDFMKTFGNNVKVLAAEGLSVLGEQFQKLGSVIAAIEHQDASFFGKTTAEIRQMSESSKEASNSLEGVNNKFSESDELLKNLRTSMAQWSQDANEKFEEPARRIENLQQKIAALEQELVNSPSEAKTIFEDIKKLVEEIESLRRKQLETEKKLTQEADEQSKKRDRETAQLREQVALNEAKLTGDKEAELAILKDRDFRRAMESGASMEDAANLSATEDALRRQDDETSGRSGGAKKPDLTFNQKVGELKGKLAAEPFFNKAQQLADAGMASSSIKAQMRGEEKMQKEIDKANLKDFFKNEFGAGNMGEAYREYLDKVGFDPNRMNEKEFKEWAKQQAKTDKEIADKMKGDKGGEDGKGGGPGGGDPFANMVALLTSIDKKLPQHALT